MGRKISDLHSKVYNPVSPTADRLDSQHQIITNLTRQVNDLANLVSNQNTRILEISNDVTALKNPAERSRVSTPPSRVEVSTESILDYKFYQISKLFEILKDKM